LRQEQDQNFGEPKKIRHDIAGKSQANAKAIFEVCLLLGRYHDPVATAISRPLKPSVVDCVAFAYAPREMWQDSSEFRRPLPEKTLRIVQVGLDCSTLERHR
jgi:hypothetical protein